MPPVQPEVLNLVFLEALPLILYCPIVLWAQPILREEKDLVVSWALSIALALIPVFLAALRPSFLATRLGPFHAEAFLPVVAMMPINCFCVSMLAGLPHVVPGYLVALGLTTSGFLTCLAWLRRYREPLVFTGTWVAITCAACLLLGKMDASLELVPKEVLPCASSVSILAVLIRRRLDQPSWRSSQAEAPKAQADEEAPHEGVHPRYPQQEVVGSMQVPNMEAKGVIILVCAVGLQQELDRAEKTAHPGGLEDVDAEV